MKMRIEPESIESAKARAIKIHGDAIGRFAIYFPGKKLASVGSEKPRYQQVLTDFKQSLIGIYDCEIDVSLILDDIEAYYDEYKVLCAARAKDVPVFRSAGRRVKKSVEAKEVG